MTCQDFPKPITFFSQKMKFFIKHFFSKCDQIRRKLWIWSHLLKKSLMGNFIFWVVFMKSAGINLGFTRSIKGWIWNILFLFFVFKTKWSQLFSVIVKLNSFWKFSVDDIELYVRPKDSRWIFFSEVSNSKLETLVLFVLKAIAILWWCCCWWWCGDPSLIKSFAISFILVNALGMEFNSKHKPEIHKKIRLMLKIIFRNRLFYRILAGWTIIFATCFAGLLRVSIS